ncbi:MAG: hypothetical protein M1824_005559 [Vezdaea acicularis]|nr:MAG: hypothetical protein M1824_005559 [Vezdaea acicularis]
MDVAYDHIQEEALSPNEASEKEAKPKGDQTNLNDEFAEAYKAISSSPWGARFGAFLGGVKKQSESYYDGARKELTTASTEASKNLTGITTSLINRTRSLSVKQPTAAESSATEKSESSGNESSTPRPSTSKPRTESEAQRDSEGVLARLRAEASKRLEDIARAEDAADEALLKFGTNIRNFLRDAVTISAPAEGTEAEPGQPAKILFESKGEDGKRVIHTTRFDAQLHVIHCSADSFIKDPASAEYAPWAARFAVDSKTDDIARHLDKYKELRGAMEKLVPDRVAYADFWKRYYFLRHVIETEEQRRRELLKVLISSRPAATGAQSHPHPEDEISWDAESESDSDSGPTGPTVPTTTTTGPSPKSNPADLSSASSTTLHPTSTSTDAKKRKSHDGQSQADSDASYDLVGAASGAPSRAPSSPKEGKGDSEEEEDWE